MNSNKCKICRRLGTKLFLKGDRCGSVKCAMIRRPYSPGEKAKKRRGQLSEYGKELKEKQKLKNWYNLSEKQFKNYVGKALETKSKTEDTGAILIKKLESRFDNVVFQMGFANSRPKARQAINHGYFLINGKKVNIPSYQVKKGDKITLHPKSSKKVIFQGLATTLKNYKAPSWIRINLDKMEVEIINQPNLEEMTPPAEVSSIFEFYSK
jgi:small subunit ribosomal protein S4